VLTDEATAVRKAVESDSEALVADAGSVVRSWSRVRGWWAEGGEDVGFEVGRSVGGYADSAPIPLPETPNPISAVPTPQPHHPRSVEYAFSDRLRDGENIIYCRAKLTPLSSRSKKLFFQRLLQLVNSPTGTRPGRQTRSRHQRSAAEIIRRFATQNLVVKLVPIGHPAKGPGVDRPNRAECGRGAR